MIVLERALLSDTSLNISCNREAAFSTTSSALQKAFNGRGFHGGRFFGAVSIPRPPPPVLHSERPVSIIPTILTMSDPSPCWSIGPSKGKDVIIVLQHENNQIPLSYVSETERRYAVPQLVQRHILAGLASVVGGLAAPYEKASHIHHRPISNWLWATGCHPFGPFSNVSQISQMLRDTALRNTIFARVDAALHKIRDTTEAVQSFTNEQLKTPLGEPVKGQRKKSNAELWLDKFYKKKTNLPEPFPHELVERLEQFLDNLEEQFVGLAGLLYNHLWDDAHKNSSEIFQNTIFTQQYVQRVLLSERDKMRCCTVEYKVPVQSSQAFIYGGILVFGFIVYFLVIFFSSPER